MTVAGGAETVEHPATGEVVWRDGEGVTCRRRHWRQGARTRLTGKTASGVFLLESPAPAELARLLEKSGPGARITVHPAP